MAGPQGVARFQSILKASPSISTRMLSTPPPHISHCFFKVHLLLPPPTPPLPSRPSGSTALGAGFTHVSFSYLHKLSDSRRGVSAVVPWLKDPVLPQPWPRSLAWEFPCAMGVAKKKRQPMAAKQTCSKQFNQHLRGRKKHPPQRNLGTRDASG